MIITTTPTIEGQSIKHYLGVVNANFVIGTNFFSDFAASFTDFLGGFSDSYQNKLAKIYQMVMKEIETRAQALGADAIVGLRIDFDEISGKEKSMFMVSATGTAVSLFPVLDSKHRMLKELSELYDYKVKGLLSAEEYEKERENIIIAYQYTINESLEVIKEKDATVKKRLEEEEKRRIEEKKLKEEIRKKAIDQLNEFINEKCSLDKINSVQESFLECTDLSVPYTTNESLEIIISKLLRSGKVIEALKYYRTKTECTLADAKEYVSDIFIRLDSIDIDNYNRLLNKLRVLKSKGFAQQAVNKYIKYSFADVKTAERFIENLC